MTTYLAPGKQKVQYVVTNAWYTALDAQSKAEDTTMTAVVIKAVEEYIQRAQLKQARRQARKQARRSS